MKTIKSFVMVLLGIVMTVNLASAQNYKAPKIDASGKVTDANGTHLGWVTKEGAINDVSGNKIASIDSEGNLVDAKTGKKMGKAQKNGNFVSEEINTPDKGWTISEAKNGLCLVKDGKGNIKGEVHENYKEQGACAIHCLTKEKK
jgi:hypothetical protein